MVAEQTFVWLSRFKKILCAMPKVHHLFYLHRMVKHRIAYTTACYKNKKKPLLPKARKNLTRSIKEYLYSLKHEEKGNHLTLSIV